MVGSSFSDSSRDDTGLEQVELQHPFDEIFDTSPYLLTPEDKPDSSDVGNRTEEDNTSAISDLLTTWQN
ncbi:hypothetical protein AC249_AIPGENE7431 [Exaiptasia diaphana]|nr:hypothetical protein AC249_AIPGENE7431 [Exaiptasia diaphana]